MAAHLEAEQLRRRSVSLSLKRTRVACSTDISRSKILPFLNFQPRFPLQVLQFLYHPYFRLQLLGVSHGLG